MNYWDNITDIKDKQTEKGMNTYGIPLEAEGDFTENERITMAEEELIDSLMYLEHMKAKHRELSANEYQRLAARTINKGLATNELINHSLHGLVGEVGEIHSLFQKVYQGHEMDEDHLKKECGDLTWFVAELCTAFGWQLGDVMNANIEKLKARYPEGFEAEKSLNRREGDI